MSNHLLPYLSRTTVEQASVDNLGWTEGASFIAHGLRFGLRSNDSAALAQVMRHFPLGWESAPIGEVDILYSIYLAPPNSDPGEGNTYSLYCDTELVVRTPDQSAMLLAFENHAQLLTAYRAKDCLFVHAGAVGWRGRAIIIPGRTMTGKTTLVCALVQAGATYYSDEFAVLDKTGRVHPYAVPLSLRVLDGQPGVKTPVESLGGQIGTEPLPLGLVVVARYEPQAKWRPRELSPARALLAMMDNTVAAQREPQYTMPILRQAVTGARAIQGKRGEAEQVARALLRSLA